MRTSLSSFVPNSRPRGFTLIELLVVISIIAILAGLSMAGLTAAMNATKRAQASTLINQVRTATIAFNTEYGVWPTDQVSTDTYLKTTDAAPWQTMTQTLAGNINPINPSGTATPYKNSATGALLNSRSIAFMEFPRKYLDTNGAVKDPTGPMTGANVLYFGLVLDSDYNGQVTITEANTNPSIANTILSTGVALWSINGTSGMTSPGIPKTAQRALTTW